MSIPEDLLEFLSQGRQLEYPEHLCDAGRVVLVSAAALAEEYVCFSGYVAGDEEPDPNDGGSGTYEAPCVNLVYDCDDYSPDFLLCWYPSLDAYGSYDPSHETGILFPNVTWGDIVADPVRYLNASWQDAKEWEAMGRFAVPILPWRYFPYVD